MDLFHLKEELNADVYYATFRRADKTHYEPGGMTLEGRRILLEHLLFIEQRDSLSLISEDEIQAVLEAWEQTEGISIPRGEITPKEFVYDGELVFLPNKTVNKKLTKTTNSVFYVTVELNMEETDVFLFMKRRQQTNQSSIYYFPSSKEYEDKKLVWNQATFVVCSSEIKTSSDATKFVFKWLGWEYGRFSEETKKAAINYLILSAFKEGFNKKNKKQYTAEPLPLNFLKDGQMSFVI